MKWLLWLIIILLIIGIIWWLLNRNNKGVEASPTRSTGSGSATGGGGGSSGSAAGGRTSSLSSGSTEAAGDSGVGASSLSDPVPAEPSAPAPAAAAPAAPPAAPVAEPVSAAPEPEPAPTPVETPSESAFGDGPADASAAEAAPAEGAHSGGAHAATTSHETASEPAAAPAAEPVAVAPADPASSAYDAPADDSVPVDDPAAAEAPADAAPAAEATAEPVADAAPIADETPAATTGSEPVAFAAASSGPGKYGEGSAEPGADGSGPDGWTVKGNEDSMKYHTPESPWYGRTIAEAWFESEDKASAAGFKRWDDKNDQAAPAAFAAVPPGKHGVGSADPGAGGSGPDGWTIKGNDDSMKFHTEDSPWYGRTIAEVWFETEDHAKAAGYKRWDDKSEDAAPAAFAAVPAGKFGDGSADPGADGSGPDGWTVKGNEDSMKYHTPESPWYGRTIAEVWFDSEGKAQAAGFKRWDDHS